MDTPSRHILSLDQRDIPYRLVSSNRATRMRIDVNRDGVRVTVPDGHPGDPHAFVREKADWIRKKFDKMEQYHKRIPDRSFEEGATFPFLGTERTIRIDDRAYSKLTSDQFVLARERVNALSIKEELEHLYRREARKVYEELADAYAEQMNVSYGTLAVRNQKTRWGSCSPHDTLSFNWRVIMAPEPIVEYLVIHELAHLKVRNHSDQFWKIVANQDSSYRSHARWLKENAALLEFDPPDHPVN